MRISCRLRQIPTCSPVWALILGLTYSQVAQRTTGITSAAGKRPIASNASSYHSATVSGTIDTIPETPGLAVWHDGHIGVYIGNGEVVEAMGTRYGVVKTKLEGARWTHWLKIPYISYD